jgi:hypothetical protein
MRSRRKKVRGAKQPTASFGVKSRIPDDRSLVLDLWVKEPPAGTFPTEELDKLPSPYLSEWNEDVSHEARLILMGHKMRFEQHKNPILAIEAFLTARAAKIFPPAWILDWLEDAFKKFHDGQGKQSLEKILRLVPRRGQSPLFKALAEEERDEMLALDVWRVMALFNTSLATASYMVSERLKETPDWNKSTFRLRSLSAKTIADRYKKKWKKILDRPDMRNRFLRDWSKEKATEYLNKFPRHSYKTEEIRPTIT